ncbi:MAG: hypothetical protein QGI89_05580 [Candidatus Woesearchaeota archaeon]|nr:hypothetical protein [Candidatus Woesearchaeota archaeon]
MLEEEAKKIKKEKKLAKKSRTIMRKKKIKTEKEKFDLAASFQKTIEEILFEKTKKAFEEFKKINLKKKNIY